jgi:hypothetical protein
VTLVELNFTKLVFNVLKKTTKFHENITNGFFADNRSWADSRTDEKNVVLVFLFVKNIQSE